jgi:hypothetical protein
MKDMDIKPLLPTVEMLADADRSAFLHISEELTQKLEGKITPASMDKIDELTNGYFKERYPKRGRD